MSVAVIRYFVSQQHGNDNNTGLSEAQAWATLTKATQTVQTPVVGDKHEVVWGPGTYREKISFSYSGRSAEEYIQYIPDPNCLYLTQDTPGRCRITGCDSDEIASSGNLVTWNNRNYVTFGCDEAECWADGVVGDIMSASSGSICIRCNIQATSCGTRYVDLYNCRITSGDINCYYGRAYNCVAVGGNDGFQYTTAYNCMSEGCSYGSSYNVCFNCNARATYAGVNQASAYNCLTQASKVGYYSPNSSGKVRPYGCYVAACSNVMYGGQYDGDKTATEVGMSIGRIGHLPYMALGVRQCGWWLRDTYNETVTGATLALTTDRTIAFTPTEPGTSKAVAVYIEAKTASGNVSCKLQKKVSGSWATQRSRTIAVGDLVNLKMNRFEWDTGSGDDQLTVASDTWRYRITADTAAQSTTIRTSNGAAVSYQGYFWPDSMPATDIDGRPRCAYGTYPSIGPWEPPDMTEEWTTYKTTAPAIKLTGNSMHIMKVAAAKNKAITVKWWVRHHGTASDKKPQIWLKGPGLTTQTATCTAAADTWEQVSVSITPTRDTVLDVCLYSRDPATGAYSIFSDPEVS